MSEENGEAVLEEPELTHEDRFSERLDAIENPVEEPAKEPAEEIEETIPTEPEEGEVEAGEEKVETPVRAEGTTASMKLLAKQSGIPDFLVQSARDDEQLEEWVTEASKRQDQPPPEQEPEYATALPEDEFPEDDPVRREFTSLDQRHEKRVATLQGNLEKVLDYVLELGDMQEKITTQTVETEQRSFHDHLDGYKHEALGQRKSLNKNNDRMRGVVFDTFTELKSELPNSSDAELVDKALKTFGFKSKQKLRSNAVRQQSQERLGGPESAKGAPEPTLSREASFMQKLEEINARS